MTMQTLDVARVVVGDAILPAAKSDSDPFESQCPDGGVMVFSAPSLETIVSSGPVAEADRVSGPLVKGLTEKARTRPADMDPFGLAAAHGNRSNSGESLEIPGGMVSISLRAERCQQTRSQRGAGAREGIENGKIGVRRRGLCDLAIETSDSFPQSGDQVDEYSRHRDSRLNQGFVMNRWY